MARNMPDHFSAGATFENRASTVEAPVETTGSLFAPALAIASVAAGAAIGTLLMLTLAGPPPERLQQDAELAGLVRVMVAAKGLLLALALALVLWRLRRPVANSSLLGYVTALALSSAAVAWMWGLSSIPVAAACFYCGLLCCYLVASRDKQLFEPTSETGRV
jgi:ABC-type Fe3+-siderophore transport system permease subunit